MQLKTILASLTLVSTFPLLILSLAACANSTQISQDSQPTESTQAQPAMNQGGEPMKDSGSSMTHDMGSMDLGPKDQNFDLRFIDGMTPHHEGAVLMAQEALQKSNRPEIKQLAQSIIDAQQKEISQLKAWRQAWYPNAGEPMMYDAAMGHMMPMSEEMKSNMMMEQSLGNADAQFDLRFINAMIPHHQGAIVMAQDAVQKSDRPEIKALAENIISSQQQEIDQMQQWKKAWYGQ